MTDWIVDIATDPHRFPVVRHRHANGTLVAERDRTPAVSREGDGPRMERWSFACPCGDVYTWDRRTPGL